MPIERFRRRAILGRILLGVAVTSFGLAVLLHDALGVQDVTVPLLLLVVAIGCAVLWFPLVGPYAEIYRLLREIQSARSKTRQDEDEP